jgi:simple sugar transport system ATP-binding protein
VRILEALRGASCIRKIFNMAYRKDRELMMSDSLLQVSNISKTFGGVHALKGVSLEIKQGEIHCLAGENGCGKSTLIKVISGVHVPEQGEIKINNRTYKQLTPIDAIHEGIQVIYQDFSVFPNLTVAENIGLNIELARKKKLINWKKMYQTSKEALDKIEVSMDLNARVETLSVADKQLIAISRALLHNAKLIIMDEPTTALTQKEVKSLFKVITGLQKEGISILFVSHKLDEVFEISEKITILRNGHNVISGEVKQFDTAKFVYYMTGRQLEESRFEAVRNNEIPLLRTENLSLKGAFEPLSFELFSGEIVGLVGLLGSGRTELASSLFGLSPATSGSIHINGKPVTIKSVQDAIDNKMAYVPEDRLTEGLFLEQSIGRNIIVGIIDKLLNSMKLIDKENTERIISRWIHDLSIVAPSPSVPVKTLSGGNQQRVVLAKWLSTEPMILILNGPTVGVDIGSKTDIHHIVRTLAEQGVGVIMISDDLPEVLQNCNRVLIMKKGRLVGEVDSRSVTEHELAQMQSGG